MIEKQWPCNTCDSPLHIKVEYDASYIMVDDDDAVEVKWSHFTQTFKSMKDFTDWLLRASHLMIKNIHIISLSNYMSTDPSKLL